MFPFNYKYNFIFKTKRTNVTSEEVISILESELMELKVINKTFILFEGFKSLLMRHRWLDDGNIRIKIKDNEVKLNLTLNFYYTPIFMGIISLVFFIYKYKTPLIGLIPFSMMFIVLILVRFWTISMYKASINRIFKSYFNIN